MGVLERMQPPGGGAHCRRPFRRGAAAFVLVVAQLEATSRVVWAETLEPAPPGPRVRVTLASSGEKVVGRLVGHDDASLFIERGRENPERLDLPRSEVTKLERSVRRSRKGRGFAIGFFVGLGVAVGVGLASGNDCGEGLDILCSETEKAVALGLLTVPLGGVIGAIAAPGEQWRTEGLPAVGVGVGPAPGGGVAARVALRF